jgi:hypothetical protein
MPPQVHWAPRRIFFCESVTPPICAFLRGLMPVNTMIPAAGAQFFCEG